MEHDWCWVIDWSPAEMFLKWLPVVLYTTVLNGADLRDLALWLVDWVLHDFPVPHNKVLYSAVLHVLDLCLTD